MDTKTDTYNIAKKAFEVVVVEDNKLANLILCKELESTINEISRTKKYPIKLKSFQFGADFLTYLETLESSHSKLIVFLDFYLENDLNGTKILNRIKQKGIDATVIILSDATNDQTSRDTVYLGAHCFLAKTKKTPIVCSSILSGIIEQSIRDKDSSNLQLKT
ncbi:MAG: hypothetical protein ABFS16_07620 [Bacteroidota bacterium]